MNEAKLLKEEFTKLKTEIISLIDKVDTNKNNYLQNYFYFISYPLFSLTESVIILCENGKPHSAEILLRSLMEAHINIIYHQVDDSDHRLAVSAKGSFDTKIQNIKQLEGLICKYPNLKPKDPTNLFDNEWLLKTGEWAKKQREAILRGNNLKETDKELDLKSKAIKCDQAALDGVEKGHFEQIYNLMFRQLSPTTHLNIEGIQTFITETEAGKYSFSDSGNGDILLAQAIEICTDFTKDLYECGVLNGKVADAVHNLEKLLKNNNYDKTP